jgi:sirohydrochlorin ferrochelatase
MTKSKGKSHFKRLKEGLEEGIAYVKGALTLKTTQPPASLKDGNEKHRLDSGRKLAGQKR